MSWHIAQLTRGVVTLVLVGAFAEAEAPSPTAPIVQRQMPSLEFVGHLDTPGSAYAITVAGEYAYVADSYGGLRVLDVSNPFSPSEVGAHVWPGSSAEDIAASGNYVYLTNGVLEIVDVANPAAPTVVGLFQAGNVFGLAVAGNYVYVADLQLGLIIVDVSNPANPIEVGFYYIPGASRGYDKVAVAGDYAYAITWGGALDILDVSNPSNPSSIAGYGAQPCFSFTRVAIADGRAYLSCWNTDNSGGLRILDITNPGQPTPLGFLNFVSGARSVAVTGDYALVPAGNSGLRVVDISNPASPNEVDYYDTPGTASGVAVANGYIYVADGSNGVVILRDADLADADGDGLPDAWELDGLDVNQDGTVDLNLRLLGADPAIKDIFVEIDYMATAGHDHQPDPAALADVERVFAAHDIAQHLIIDEAVPEIEPILFSTQGPGAADDFNDLKLGNPVEPCGTGPNDGHFGSITDRSSPNCMNMIDARRQVFRYAIFGHDHAHQIGSSGIAELPGNDFMVTLGGWTNDGLNAVGGRRAAEASTLMHELGHTLGLGHGGGDGVNCKPNYLSVMNYSLQFAYFDPTRPLDYSIQSLPSLDENAGLSEPAGIGGPVDRRVIYGINGTIETPPPPANGPINWNGDSDSYDINVTADINRISLMDACATAGLSLLTGFNDWGGLVYNFRTSSDFADGSTRITPHAVAEVATDQAVTAAESVDFDEDGFSNASDNCPAILNPTQTDTDGDGIGDACEVYPVYLPLIRR